MDKHAIKKLQNSVKLTDLFKALPSSRFLTEGGRWEVHMSYNQGIAHHGHATPRLAQKRVDHVIKTIAEPLHMDAYEIFTLNSTLRPRLHAPLNFSYNFTFRKEN